MRGECSESILRKSLRLSSHIISAVFFIALLGLSAPVSAQSLNIEPGCGMAGSTVKITGSGWAEPSPPCDYRFYFDGAEFASRQPDGLFGPPNRTATIPAGASAGMHIIKVELRISSNGQLLQCRQIEFKVIDQNLDPFANNVSPAAGGTDATGTVDYKFDPKDVCDPKPVTPCTKLTWIQALKQVGVKADGTTVVLKYADFNFPNAANYDMDTVPATGLGLDVLWGCGDPYYPTCFAGNHGSTPATPTRLFDRPGETTFPTDIVTIRFEFESNVFCGEGQNKGSFPGGRVIWKWEKNMGSAGNVGAATVVSVTRDNPTSAFLGAIQRWDTNHGTWQMPTPSPQTPGGKPCN